MNNERYNQIIDEAYENYLKGGEIKWLKTKEYDVEGVGIINVPIPYSKEEFVEQCKTIPEFSERWGLKIAERELSLEERKKIYERDYADGFEVVNDHWLESKLKTRDIPTKLITKLTHHTIKNGIKYTTHYINRPIQAGDPLGGINGVPTATEIVQYIYNNKIIERYE